METRVSTVSKVVSLIKGSLFFICFYASTKYAANPLVAALSSPYSNLRFLYFTHISLYTTLLTFAVGFIYRTKRKLFKLYNVLIPLSFTLEFLVTFTFWAIYYHDPCLIKGRIARLPQYQTPVLTELGQHLFPFILIILEQIDVHIQRSRVHTPLIVFFCAIWYTVISIVAKYKNGVYPYPFMKNIRDEKLRLALLSLFIISAFTIQKIYILIKTRKNK